MYCTTSGPQTIDWEPLFHSVILFFFTVCQSILGSLVLVLERCTRWRLSQEKSVAFVGCFKYFCTHNTFILSYYKLLITPQNLTQFHLTLKTNETWAKHAHFMRKSHQLPQGIKPQTIFFHSVKVCAFLLFTLSLSFDKQTHFPQYL